MPPASGNAPPSPLRSLPPRPLWCRARPSLQDAWRRLFMRARPRPAATAVRTELEPKKCYYVEEKQAQRTTSVQSLVDSTSPATPNVSVLSGKRDVGQVRSAQIPATCRAFAQSDNAQVVKSTPPTWRRAMNLRSLKLTQASPPLICSSGRRNSTHIHFSCLHGPKTQSRESDKRGGERGRGQTRTETDARSS
jgi:hypothetical protein